MFTYVGNHFRAETDVGDKHSVHNVAVNHIRACRRNTLRFPSHIAKIGGKHRRRNHNLFYLGIIHLVLLCVLFAVLHSSKILTYLS